MTSPITCSTRPTSVMARLLCCAGFALIGCNEPAPKVRIAPAPTGTDVQATTSSPIVAVEELAPTARPQAKLPDWVVRAIQPEHFMVAVLRAAEARQALEATDLWNTAVRYTRVLKLKANNPLALLEDDAIDSHAVLWATDSVLTFSRYKQPQTPEMVQRIYTKTYAGPVEIEKIAGRSLRRPKSEDPSRPVDLQTPNCLVQLDEHTLAVSDYTTLTKTLALWDKFTGAGHPLAMASGTLVGDELLSITALRRPADKLIEGLAKQPFPFSDRLKPLIDSAGSIESAALSVRAVPLGATLNVLATDPAGATALHTLAENYVRQARDAVAQQQSATPAPNAESRPFQRKVTELLGDFTSKLTTTKSGQRVIATTTSSRPLGAIAEQLRPVWDAEIRRIDESTGGP